jgi:8-oxo-dGTP pyrophosphatase MutT (NUDIX family)
MNSKNNFFDYLYERLSGELPGAKAHIKMAPFGDLERLENNKPRPNSKRSAVLLLLTENKDVLFTLRSSKLRKHSGQISFPGGRQDPNETDEETALRETEEEVGIPPSNIELLGTLSNLYVPPSDNVIQPVVAKLSKPSPIIVNPDEVDEAFFVNLNQFEGEEKLKVKSTEYKGKPFSFPYWDVHHKVPLWGATAIIMSEFMHLVDEFTRKNS